MGVHGLWKLLEPSGQMVPLESLAGKIVAVDVSIWLHQAIKGMHDTYGAPMEAAHLIILFHRLCKLLYYKIKPIFVFDGGVPALKHQTLAARRQQSNIAKNEVLKVREKLIKNLLKHEAVRQVLSNETASIALGLNSFALPGPSAEEDLYKLPPMAADYDESASSEDLNDEEEDDDKREKRFENIHSVDVTSQKFLSLPAEVRHDILTELIETRKQSSWKHLDSMPADSDDFSDFQMNRLLKRHAVQTSLEKAGKEMGGKALSLKELESMLGEKGVVDANACISGRRIAQDNVTRYMLVQKDQIPELDEKEGNSEGFDIMNRLDEVQWSSDSDTDIILEKSRKVKNTGDQKPESESLTISKRPIVQLTKEVEDILTILEGEDIESDVKAKVQSIREQFMWKEAAVKSEPIELKNIEKKEIDSISHQVTSEHILNVLIKNEPVEEETVDVTSEMPKDSVSEGLLMPCVKTEDVTSKAGDVKYKEEKEAEVFKESTEAVEQKALETSKLENGPVEQVPHESQELTKTTETEQSENSVVTIEREFSALISESSSDSDSDFVSISVPDSEKQVENKQEFDTVAEKSASETFQAISITVKPSPIGDGDDIFADVFQSVPEPEVSEIVTDKKGIESEIESEEDIEKFENKTEEADEIQLDKEMSIEKLNDLKKSLEEKQFNLMMERGKQERQALNPTDQMYSDAQELLRLFGVPFIVAPMEAEAQCACLDSLGLTEGTITDDSDIWLFGGRVVYKNFFNQKKHVLEYRAVNIQKCFKLSREDLIRMAMLVGSDYTVGLNGIGPVTALEILASFPSSGESLFEGLEKFRDWFTGRNPSTSPRTSLKRKIRNTVISPGFPNRAVADAYLHPQVDDSREPFSWAKPNLELIRKYVKLKIGWSPDKCTNLLQPVLKKMEESSSQSVMERYLRGVPNTVGVLSKRVEKAIKRLESKEEDGDEDEGRFEGEPKPKKRRAKKEGKADDNVERDEVQKEKRKRKQRNKSIEDVGNDASTSSFSIKPLMVPLQQQQQQSSAQKTKEILLKEKLHREEKIPQKERSQKMLEERKKEAIEIFRTYKGKGRRKKKVFAKKEANLSESSSEGD